MKKRTKTSAVVLAGMLGVTTVFPSGVMMHPSCVKQVAQAASSSIDANNSGECGEEVSYVFADGVLTISGNGTIEEKAFKEITKITSVVILDGVTGIGNAAFSGCTELSSITIPNTVTTIGSHAFANTKLTELTLPENLTTLGAFILNENIGVKNLTIPKTVETMQALSGGYHGSLNGSAVENIVFADGMETIPVQACHGATNLKKVTLPDSVTTLDNECFAECSALTEIILPANLNKIGTRAFEKTGLIQLNLPNTVTEIGAFILNENKTVKSLTIPKSVTTMQSLAGGYHGSLYGSAVETVLFEDGLENLPSQALQGAKSLTKATIPVSVVSVGEDAIAECENVKIYCYSGSYIDEYALQNNIAYEYIGEAKDSVITASDYNLTSKSSKQNFKIDTQVEGLGALTYLSDKAAVTVDTEGNVTIAPDFVGTATITIKVSSVGEYKAGSKDITVSVKPATTKISKLKNAKKNKMTIKWSKKSKVTGYQIQYSTNSKFKKSVKNVTISNSNVSSQTITSLKNKKTYYVRIRTYKTVSGVTYYSDWSTAKKIKITK